MMCTEGSTTLTHMFISGLAAIHKTGTAHRDLKPANVLLAPNDRVVIMDLGSAAPARIEIGNYNAAQRLQGST